MTADPARAERLGKRQLEQSVCWTSGERLRCLWYQFRLTWQEINYAAAWWSCRSACQDNRQQIRRQPKR